MKQELCTVCKKEVGYDSGALITKMSDELDDTYTHWECCDQTKYHQMVIVDCGQFTDEMIKWINKNSTFDFENFKRNFHHDIELRKHPDVIRLAKKFKELEEPSMSVTFNIITVPNDVELELNLDCAQEWVQEVHQEYHNDNRIR